MPSKTGALSFVLILFMGASSLAGTPPMATVVRTEALRSQHDQNGRPLPLVAGWESSGISLSTQISMIQDGVPLLPWIINKAVLQNSDIPTSDQDALKTFREWNIPIALISTQWEGQFTLSSDYKNLPIEKTGLGLNIDGSKMAIISPLSPIEPWRELGKKWTDDTFIKSLQSFYPDPPLIFFISNNEAQKLNWTAANTEKRFVDLHGTNTTDEFKRQAFGDGWIKNYLAMFQGMRDGLTSPAWKNNSRFIEYDSLALDHLGRWWGWKEYSLTTEKRIAPDWYMWDGSIPEAYDNYWEPKTAYTLWSMQSELMNLVFMKEEAFKVKPDFWFELIFWDGYSVSTSGTVTDATSKYDDYQRAGITYTPELYGGWEQYSLWLLVPRVAREFRWTAFESPSRFMPYFERIINSVKAVHDNSILSRFWRKGELVPNTARKHPFQLDIPAKWIDEKRWFALSTNLDPDGNDYSLKWPVWALARVIGEKPTREWLVYAHAPMGAKTNVQVTIPDYKTIDLPSISVGGSFYHVIEASGSISEVGDNSTPAIPSPKAKLIQPAN